jgi:hypothetical protein
MNRKKRSSGKWALFVWVQNTKRYAVKSINQSGKFFKNQNDASEGARRRFSLLVAYLFKKAFQTPRLKR